jgi:hypothetical protein
MTHFVENRFISLWLIIAFFCSWNLLSAQVNLKTGYNLSFPSAKGMNQLIDIHNEQTGYDDPFSNMEWLHGLEAGFRLKGGIHALELTYQGSYQSLKATKSVAGQSYTDKLKSSIHALCLGYQVSEGHFGLGADFQYQFHRLRFEDGLTEVDFKETQRIPALKLYLMLTLGGAQAVDMAVQPYVVLPLRSLDYTGLKQHLQIEETISPEKWVRFGITLLFYNGQK